MIRAASLAAGFPNTTCASSVNRFCSSGLKAVQDIANQITLGSIDCGLAIGAESMTHSRGSPSRPFVDEIRENQEARDCEQPMGQTSENVGKDFGITREMQDRFAYTSYQRAEIAQKEGWSDDEIVPITTILKDPKTGEEKTVTLTKDEGPRWGTTYEALSKVRPAFKQFGDRSTGGNSSQVTDGAAAVLLMRRSVAERLGQPILAKYVNAAVAGLPPRIMGIGPSIAIPKLLTKLQITLDDVDVIEINEAFASMMVYCVNKLNIDTNKLNIRGGAIALGHPLGATGARQIVTGLSECRRQKKKVLLTSMCIGTVSDEKFPTCRLISMCMVNFFSAGTRHGGSVRQRAALIDSQVYMCIVWYCAWILKNNILSIRMILPYGRDIGFSLAFLSSLRTFPFVPLSLSA